MHFIKQIAIAITLSQMVIQNGHDICILRRIQSYIHTIKLKVEEKKYLLNRFNHVVNVSLDMATYITVLNNFLPHHHIT